MPVQTTNNAKPNGIYSRLTGKCIAVVSLLAALFHIYISYGSEIGVMQQRVIHVFILFFLWYMYKGQKKLAAGKKTALAYHFLAVLTLALGGYYLMNTTAAAMLDKGIFGPSPQDIVMGVLLALIVLDVTRDAIGWALTITALLFTAFAVFGPYMPDIIAHKGYDISYITNYIGWTLEGIFGTPIGASVSFVTIYIIFGDLLDRFGAGKFFIDIAYALTGRIKGGPAEAAVVSSALMGSINGSAVANVVTTGTFTIPLMKKVGYKPYYAGAVEAVASTGGQILPPVMGAAAFVMADMTGIPYSTIVIAAIVPGILYYLSLGIAVYLEAGRLGIQAEPKENLPSLARVVKTGWYYTLPLIVLIYCLLGIELSANYSAIFAILALLIVGIAKYLREEKRFPLKEIVEALINAMKTTIPVATACACAGVVIGIVSMTGIGVKFTQIVFELSGGNIILMLLMIMLACIVLGTGLPSTAAYVIAATIGVPALLKAGIPPLAANLFVFYFAIVSFITPPVALAAYAGAGIAGANSMRTGLQAFMLGLSGFIIPFAYVFKPSLLIIGAAGGEVLTAISTAALAIAVIPLAVGGWLNVRLNAAFRVLLLAASIALIAPSDAGNIAGAAVCSLVLGAVYLQSARKAKNHSAG
jgi:TRAP transporter 4TM/12TM fusion protein